MGSFVPHCWKHLEAIWQKPPVQKRISSFGFLFLPPFFFLVLVPFFQPKRQDSPQRPSSPSKLTTSYSEVLFAPKQLFFGSSFSQPLLCSSYRCPGSVIVFLFEFPVCWREGLQVLTCPAAFFFPSWMRRFVPTSVQLGCKLSECKAARQTGRRY